jgi:hypothetical protein
VGNVKSKLYELKFGKEKSHWKIYIIAPFTKTNNVENLKMNIRPKSRQAAVFSFK